MGKAPDTSGKVHIGGLLAKPVSALSRKPVAPDDSLPSDLHAVERRLFQAAPVRTDEEAATGTWRIPKARRAPKRLLRRLVTYSLGLQGSNSIRRLKLAKDGGPVQCRYNNFYLRFEAYAGGYAPCGSGMQGVLAFNRPPALTRARQR